MDKYRKTDGGKYYLKQHNKSSGELEWIEIQLESSTEPEYVEGDNEKIIHKPQHDYYFTHDDERPNEELPMGIQWENLGYFE